MISQDDLQALDGLQWLGSGHAASAVLGISQATMSRSSSRALKLFELRMERQEGEWQLIGDASFLQMERRVHQVARWMGHRPLRLEATYWSAPTLCAGLPPTWRLGRSNIVGVGRNLQLVRERIVDAWIAGLPDLPSQPKAWPDLERQAMTERLDVRAARAGAQATAHQLGLTRTTRFINVLEWGLVNNTANDAPTQRGWEVTVELPLFDWGQARVARAESLYMQSLHRAAQTAIQARSEVREAYVAYRYAWDIAKHQRDEIVPIKSRISEENLLRYNGMLIGVFELLADARSQIASVNAAIDALRDFWQAQADLDLAMVGKPSLSHLGSLTSSTASSTSTPDAAGAGH